MNRKFKVIISIIIILLGVVALIFFLKNKSSKTKFQLINQVSEADIAYHTDLIEVLDDVIQYNSEVEQSLANKVALNRFKDELLNSGLNNDHVFITHSFKNLGITSFYVEILDSAAFSLTFNQLSALLKLSPIKDSIGYYISKNKKVSVEKHVQYVKFNFGKGAELALSEKSSKPSQFFTQQLEKSNSGLINTTGTPFVDSTDYATFSYSYDKKVVLNIDWNVSKNHPLQTNKNKVVQLYPTQKKNVKVITNLDLEKLQANINPFLKEIGEKQLNKLPVSARELLKIWTGKASMQMGGKTAQETIQFVTEFDDDFNQVERKIIKVDSIPNIGFYWSTNESSRTLELLDKLPNVKFENDKLQIALLPSLVTKKNDKSIKASSRKADYVEKSPKQIIQLSVDTEGLKGTLTVENKNKETVHIHFTLEDWEALNDTKSLKISSFW